MSPFNSFYRQSITMNIGRRRKRRGAEVDNIIIDTMNSFEEAESQHYSSVHMFQDSDCRLEMWRCLSQNFEDIVISITDKSSLTERVQKMFFKIVFHGPKMSMWESLMQISWVRLTNQSFYMIKFLYFRLKRVSDVSRSMSHVRLMQFFGQINK